MQFDVIGSGSSGNCTFIKSLSDSIIIDLGISGRRVCKALQSYNETIDDVKAFFVSHSHSDHTQYYKIAPMEKIYSADMYVFGNALPLDSEHILSYYKPIQIGCFKITPIPLSHDANKTIGFIVDDGKQSLVQITDTGFIAEIDFPILQNRDYYIIESNHDMEMLLKSDRPYILKHRISSDKGHINNEDCGYYLSCFLTKKTKQVILAHLSSECNTQDIALKTVKEVIKTQLGFLPDVDIRCASQKEEVKGGEDDI